jgi:GntP family gluconate:H+ symporter
MLPPLVILLIAVATVVGAIVLLRLNAFLALLAGAIIVSLLAAGAPATKIARVAEGFGKTAGSIGIVIALASIIGKAMMESGAADRIVQAFLALLGEERGAVALGATGFVLSIPVFFDTVFYLLVPLARSMHRRTGRDYLKYIMAIAAGAAATHTLVPPTPGPLAVASLLGVDIGTMVIVGFVVAVPAAIAGFLYAGWMNGRMPITPPVVADEAPDATARATTAPPGLLPSMTPIALPVLLISSNTLTSSIIGSNGAHAPIWDALAPYTAVLGNANLALFFSAAFGLWLFTRQRRASRAQVAELTEESLASAGPIILITAAGGAFGATLQAAQVGPAIQGIFTGHEGSSGVALLVLAFAVASLIKIAQGSSTVAMITTAGMIAAMLRDTVPLPFHPVYLATAIAGGSLVGTWMNDSGFWVFTRLGGVTETQALRTWTPVAAIVGTTAMLTTVAMALLLPLR